MDLLPGVLLDTEVEVVGVLKEPERSSVRSGSFGDILGVLGARVELRDQLTNITTDVLGSGSIRSLHVSVRLHEIPGFDDWCATHMNRRSGKSQSPPYVRTIVRDTDAGL